MYFPIISILLVLLVGSLIGGIDFAVFTQLAETLNAVNQSLGQ